MAHVCRNEEASEASREPRPKQQFIDGMQPPSFPEIDELADIYRDKRDRRVALLSEEVAAQEELHEAMKKHELTTYTYDEYVVSVKAAEKVSVKRKKAETNGEAEE